MPDRYNDGTNGIHNVTYIADGTSETTSVFYPIKSTLTTITLPSTTTKIGSYAFMSCSGLTSLNLSGCTSLTSIYPHAFRYTGLKKITLPSSLITIDDYAFYSCRSLTSITIPEDVTKIGKYAFSSCTALTSATFGDTSTWYYTSDSSYTGGTRITLSKVATNATYLKSTYTSYYWYRK